MKKGRRCIEIFRRSWDLISNLIILLHLQDSYILLEHASPLTWCIDLNDINDFESTCVCSFCILSIKSSSLNTNFLSNPTKHSRKLESPDHSWLHCGFLVAYREAPLTDRITSGIRFITAINCMVAQDYLDIDFDFCSMEVKWCSETVAF